MSRRRRTADQWQALIEQQAQSPLSMAEFCKRKGLSLSSFHRWRGKLSHKPQPASFLEVEAPVCTEESMATWNLEVDLPGGGHLRLRFEP